MQSRYDQWQSLFIYLGCANNKHRVIITQIICHPDSEERQRRSTPRRLLNTMQPAARVLALQRADCCRRRR